MCLFVTQAMNCLKALGLECILLDFCLVVLVIRVTQTVTDKYPQHIFLTHANYFQACLFFVVVGCCCYLAGMSMLEIA